jgi:transposase-like protein
MFNVTLFPGGNTTMTKTDGKTASAAVKDILLSNPDGPREVIRTVMQEVLEAEMDETLGAAKGERTPGRLGYCSGHYGRTLITRVGKLVLQLQGRFKILATAPCRT